MFTDSAAMTAAAKLDGTSAGLDRARDAVAHLPMRWNLGTATVHRRGHRVQRRRRALGIAIPRTPRRLTMARVTAPANGVDIVFLRAVGGPKSFTVPARSVAAIESGEADE